MTGRCRICIIDRQKQMAVKSGEIPLGYHTHLKATHFTNPHSSVIANENINFKIATLSLGMS